jgi:phosphoribosylformimino-5-aminoimidazole carboxamide ribonucleotide (ProFAR) isomerase
MWNSDPARRFVIIDGQRRVEGDRLGEAVITAIDRDGVLLELDGRALRIPLP